MGKYEDHTQDAIDYGMYFYGSEIQKIQRIHNLKKLDRELKDYSRIMYNIYNLWDTMLFDAYQFNVALFPVGRKSVFKAIKIMRRIILSMIRRLKNTPTVLDAVVEKIYENLKKNNHLNKYVTVPLQWDQVAFSKPRTIAPPLIFDEFVAKREQENE